MNLNTIEHIHKELAQNEVDNVFGSEQDVSEEDISRQQPALRRSTRPRKAPDRFQAGSNAIVKSGECDWKEKCMVLMSCMREFPDCRMVFANAIAKIM